MKSVWDRSRPRSGWLVVLAALAAISASNPASAAAANYDMRGQWSLALSGGPNPIPLTVRIKEMEATSGALSGAGTLAGYFAATISGTVSGEETSITISSQTPEGPAQFIAPKVTIDPATNTVSGMGAYYKEGNMVAPGKLTGQRTMNYTELVQTEREELKIKERELREAEERAAQEKLEREAREKTEREAKEALEAKEKPEREAREAKEQLEREAIEKAEREAQAALKATLSTTGTSGTQNTVQLVSVLTTASSYALDGSGIATIGLKNPNGEAVSGKVTLVFDPVSPRRTTKGKHRHATKKALLLAGTSYTAPAQGQVTVKVKLPRAIAVELGQRKRLHAVMRLTTQGHGPSAILKTLQVTLRTGAPARHR